MRDRFDLLLQEGPDSRDRHRLRWRGKIGPRSAPVCSVYRCFKQKPDFLFIVDYCSIGIPRTFTTCTHEFSPPWGSVVLPLFRIPSPPLILRTSPARVWTMSGIQQKPWSGNPNAPKVPHDLSHAEKVYFAGILIASILYGMCDSETPSSPLLLNYIRPVRLVYSRDPHCALIPLHDRIV